MLKARQIPSLPQIRAAMEFGIVNETSGLGLAAAMMAWEVASGGRRGRTLGGSIFQVAFEDHGL